MKFGLPTSPFFTILKILFLLVGLACTVTLTGFWHRLTTNPYLDYPSLQPLRGVAGPSERLDSGLITEMACARVWCCLLGKEASP